MRDKFALAILILFPSLFSAQNTVGLINYEEGNTDGYVLFSPITSTNTYLINKCGEKVHEWNASAYRPGLSCSLLEDGSLLRTGQINNPNFDEGGSGGLIEKFDWDGNLTWTFTVSDVDFVQHHDIAVLPNGNLLVLAWDRYTNDEALANGKATSYVNPYLWSEKIIEIQPIGTNDAIVLWEWKVWDHLIQELDATKPNFNEVSDHPELVHINYFPGQPTSMDWIHFNSIDYNPDLDQIVLSSHTFNEIWLIDHSTTTAEAASHLGGNSNKGGDLLYRWGNPQSYQRGNPSTKVFFGQHHATWIPSGLPNAGKIMVFNNGLNRPGNFSSIDIIEPPVDISGAYTIEANNPYAPEDLFWTYIAPVPSDFYSSNISGVYPINESFIITSGSNGVFFEINTNSETVWKYINPITQSGLTSQGDAPQGNLVFRCEFYLSSYPAFNNQNLISLGEIELNPNEPSICNSTIKTEDVLSASPWYTAYPNPAGDQITITTSGSPFQVHLYNSQGQLVITQQDESVLNMTHLSKGIYVVHLLTKEENLIPFQIIKE